MTAPDLSKLRIDRDAPPTGVSRALKRNAMLAGLTLLALAPGRPVASGTVPA